MRRRRVDANGGNVEQPESLGIAKEWEKERGFYKLRENGRGRKKEIMHWNFEKIKPVSLPGGEGSVEEGFDSEFEEGGEEKL